jgi:hypothetical protein
LILLSDSFFLDLDLVNKLRENEPGSRTNDFHDQSLHNMPARSSQAKEVAGLGLQRIDGTGAGRIEAKAGQLGAGVAEDGVARGGPARSGGSQRWGQPWRGGAARKSTTHLDPEPETGEEETEAAAAGKIDGGGITRYRVATCERS